VSLLVVSLLLVAGLLGALWYSRHPKPPLPPVPPGCEAAEGAVAEDFYNKRYYEKVDRLLPDESRIRFVLVRKLRRSDPDTFYMMENKVSVGQFRLFDQTNAGQVQYEKWNRNDNNKFPVLEVTFEDASRFARWLGGDLPTTEQWDKAAGAYEDDRGEGPYKGHWDAGKKLDIAVGLDDPREVGTAEDDRSLFECRDMAGNGAEWTRTLFDGGAVPANKKLGPDDQCWLRGRTFSEPDGRPLRFEDLKHCGIRRCTERPLEYLGFRVVIEPQ
jgi:formylglycine-generating enzyme required for sulfatase activity